jgi:hypothetical protein
VSVIRSTCKRTSEDSSILSRIHSNTWFPQARSFQLSQHRIAASWPHMLEIWPRLRDTTIPSSTPDSPEPGPLVLQFIPRESTLAIPLASPPVFKPTPQSSLTRPWKESRKPSPRAVHAMPQGEWLYSTFGNSIQDTVSLGLPAENMPLGVLVSAASENLSRS